MELQQHIEGFFTGCLVTQFFNLFQCQGILNMFLNVSGSEICLQNLVVFIPLEKVVIVYLSLWDLQLRISESINGLLQPLQQSKVRENLNLKKD